MGGTQDGFERRFCAHAFSMPFVENNHAKVLIFVDVELKTIVPGWMVD